MKIEELKKYIKETKTDNFYFTGLKEKTIDKINANYINNKRILEITIK